MIELNITLWQIHVNKISSCKRILCTIKWVNNFHAIMSWYVITLDKTGPSNGPRNEIIFCGRRMPLDALRLPLQSYTFVRTGKSWFSGFLCEKERWRMEELSFGRDIKDVSACETVRRLDFRVILIHQAWSQLSNRLPLFPVIMIYTQSRIDGRVHRMQCISR